ncbi:hypothetical protein [Streptomyces uncialis]|uniref:hypothetical protein n=1 Tax=Streptomyces uncialis TaxID=1048205 RepID=UPI0033E57119
MGTRTEDNAAAGADSAATGTEAGSGAAGAAPETATKSDADRMTKTPDAAKAPDTVEKDGAAADGTVQDAAADDGTDLVDDDEGLDDEDLTVPVGKAPSGVGQGAAAVVSAALGVVGLSGGWIGTVASARESIIGQLEASSSGAGVAQQIQEVYGDAWHATALVGGIFALVALIVGAATLVRPLFGTPGTVQAPWVRSVAWAGVSLGVIGLLLSVAKYTDVLLSLPSAG